MADIGTAFTFLDSLSPEQEKVAEKIIEEATKRGINPRFAIALAWTENKFTNKPGSLDEIGIMQVRPGTAKQYGYNPKDLLDESRNIEIGLDILKRHLDAFDNDPWAAATAYNAGPDTPILVGKENAKLPGTTADYLRKIQGFGGFTEMPAKEEPPTQSEELKQKQLPLEEQFKQALSDPELKKQLMFDLAGAGAGAVGSKVLDVGSDAMQMFRDRRDVLAAQAAAARSGLGVPPEPIPTDPMHTRQMQGTTDGGATGKARQTTFNTATAQQSAAAKEQEGLMKQLQQRGVITGDAKSVLAKAPGLTATPSGVLLPSSQVYADIPPPQGTTPPPKPSLMQRTQQTTANVGRAMGRGALAPFRSPIVSGAIGGLGAAESGTQAFEYGMKGKLPEAAVAGMGALGGLAAIMPLSAPVRAIGAATAVVSPIALRLYEKAKEREMEKQGLEQMGMQQEAMPSLYRKRYQ